MFSAQNHYKTVCIKRAFNAKNSGFYVLKACKQLRNSTSKMADYKRTLLTFACSLLLLTQALLALNRYLKHEYKTRMEIVPLHKAHFLSFTVCPSYGAAYKREVLEKYGTTASRYRKGDFFTPNANKSHKEVFQDVTFGLHEMVASVTIQRSFDEVTIAPSSNQSGWLWTELSYVALGRCFSLQLEEEFVASGINTIAFKTNIDVLIYLHHPGQFYAPNSRSRVSILSSVCEWQIALICIVDCFEQRKQSLCGCNL